MCPRDVVTIEVVSNTSYDRAEQYAMPLDYGDPFDGIRSQTGASKTLRTLYSMAEGFLTFAEEILRSITATSLKHRAVSCNVLTDCVFLQILHENASPAQS